jgi:uncharacterized protein (TIGR03435 family)
MAIALTASSFGDRRGPNAALRTVGWILLVASAYAACGSAMSLIAQSASADTAAPARIPNFAVSWVKPTRVTDGRWRLAPTSDGWSALDVSVWQMIKEAYAIDQDDQILGAPQWLSTEKFDFEAKIDDADIAAFQALHYDQERVMLQRLLADRFSLATHFETRQLPVYALTVAKGGPKLHESVLDPNDPMVKRGLAQVRKSNGHQIAIEKCSMPILARTLTRILGAQVVDQTGLTGRYDFELDWAPALDANISAANNAASAPAPDGPTGPSIFAAIKDQLGLKLESTKAPVQALAIDHVAEPSPN